jgi:glycosyltransferase involved in cell wall biosynthesis
VKILQLTSDWKWTGPAEPMLRLAVALRARGHEVLLAAPEAPDPARRSLLSEAREAGVAPDLILSRGRGVRPLRDGRDARALATLLALRRIEVVHAWHTRDHLLAVHAARARRARGESVVVRSHRSFDPPRATPWARWLFGPGADALVCVSPRSAAAHARLRGGRQSVGLFGAVDLRRFRPQPRDPAVRRELGLPEDAPVVGIVARVQRHRRFDLLLEAAAHLFERVPSARLLVVGRGTHRAEVAEEPARRLGIAGRVTFAGYRHGDYADVLRAIDVFTFLVPGSDGTCRALLEAQACGIPAVVSRRGALPEIVLDGKTGIVVDEETGALAGAWEALASDTERRRALGAAAADRATARFAPERLAAEIESLYARTLRAARGEGPG